MNQNALSHLMRIVWFHRILQIGLNALDRVIAQVRKHLETGITDTSGTTECAHSLCLKYLKASSALFHFAKHVFCTCETEKGKKKECMSALPLSVNFRGEWMDISFDQNQNAAILREEGVCVEKMLGECRLLLNRREGKLLQISIPCSMIYPNYAIKTTYSEEVDIYMIYFMTGVRTARTQDYLQTVMMDLSEEGKLISFELMGFLFSF